MTNGADTSPPWDGRPLNPERDGWHWVEHVESKKRDVFEWMVADWHHNGGLWLDPECRLYCLGWRYLGPCLLPDEVAVEVRCSFQRGFHHPGDIDEAMKTVTAATYARGWKAGAEKARQSARKACRRAVPRAHTYASENADIYRAGDRARDRCEEAIAAMPLPEPEGE